MSAYSERVGLNVVERIMSNLINSEFKIGQRVYWLTSDINVAFITSIKAVKKAVTIVEKVIVGEVKKKLADMNSDQIFDFTYSNEGIEE
jgi:hypothetical protein